MIGKYVLITGGTGGLGRAVTLRCAELGAHITLPYRNEKEFIQLKSEMDEDLLVQVNGVKADLLNEQDILSVLKEMPRIDILLHLMGGFSMAKTSEMPLGEWQFQMDINLTSAFLMIKHVLVPMQEQDFGRIITIGSRAALEAPGEMAAYASAKAGLIALTRSVASEIKGRNITANIILPSIIDTPANRSAMGEENAGRWVTPQSLSKIIAFLVSDTASDIRGACIPVYGDV